MNTPSTTTAPLIPDRVVPELYISDMLTARAVLSPNYQTPDKTRPNIRYVLSIVDKAIRQPKLANESQKSDFVFKLILLDDTPDSNLLAVLPEACDFIKTSMAKKDGGILVHCRQGISRSSSAIIAYIMEDMDLEYDTALRFVRKARAKVRPNAGFERQLRLWNEMKFSLYDDTGSENPQYRAWKNSRKKVVEERNGVPYSATQNTLKVPQTTVKVVAEKQAPKAYV